MISSNLDSIFGVSREISGLNGPDSMILNGGEELYYEMRRKWKYRTPGLEVYDSWYYTNLIRTAKQQWGIDLRNSHSFIRNWCL